MNSIKVILSTLFLLIYSFFSTLYAEELKLATGFKGGTYYSMGMDLKKIWSKVGIKTRVLESKGAWQNLLDVFDGKVDLAFTQADALALANVQYKKNTGKNLKDYIKIVSILHPEEIHILTNGKIRNFRELNGARVSCGPKNSGSCVTADFLAYAFNLKMNLINASYKESLKMLKNGSIDALIITVGKPAPMLSKLHGFYLLSIPSNEKLRFLNRATIGPEDYPWLKNSVITYSIPSYLITKYYNNEGHKRLIGTLELSILANESYLKKFGHNKWKDAKLHDIDLDFQHPTSTKIIKTCLFFSDFKYSCDGMKPLSF